MKINLPDKLYYSIGEVANAFNVNTSKIRHWEKEFPILKPRRNAKGNRYFTPEDIIVVDRKNKETVFRRLKEEELGDWLQDYTMGEIWKSNLIGGRP